MTVAETADDACGVCGRRGPFTIADGWSLREASCGGCGATRRNSDTATAIAHAFAPGHRGGLAAASPRLSSLRIFEAQAAGPIHAVLKALPGYLCAEYLDGVAPGARGPGGIRCEDLERLTFSDASLDLVVTQDVLEHVRDPEAAFREVSRVLRPRGWHVFTVPVHEGHPTVARVRRRNGQEARLDPPVYHADPLRDAGSLVCTDFGDDLPEILARLRIPVSIAVRHEFYAPHEIPWIHDDASHADYLRRTRDASLESLLRYFRYNSIVFRAGKAAARG